MGGSYVNDDECRHAICILAKDLLQKAPPSRQEELYPVIKYIEGYFDNCFFVHGELRTLADEVKNFLKAIYFYDTFCKLDGLWVLESEKCDNYIQWLPYEIVKDTQVFMFAGRFFQSTTATDKDVNEKASATFVR